MSPLWPSPTRAYTTLKHASNLPSCHAQGLWGAFGDDPSSTLQVEHCQVALQHITFTEGLRFLREHARKCNTGISQISSKVTRYLAHVYIFGTLLEKERLLGIKEPSFLSLLWSSAQGSSTMLCDAALFSSLTVRQMLYGIVQLVNWTVKSE